MEQKTLIIESDNSTSTIFPKTKFSSNESFDVWWFSVTYSEDEKEQLENLPKDEKALILYFAICTGKNLNTKSHEIRGIIRFHTKFCYTTVEAFLGKHITIYPLRNGFERMSEYFKKQREFFEYCSPEKTPPIIALKIASKINPTPKLKQLYRKQTEIPGTYIPKVIENYPKQVGKWIYLSNICKTPARPNGS